jgi:hypothetical protein
VVSAVAAAVDPVFGAAADDRPGAPHAVPHRGVDHVRAAGLQLDVDGAGAVGEEEDTLPGAATIARAIHPPSGRVGKWISDDRGKYDVGIRGMHDDRADLAGIAQADEAPGASGVRRLVDPLPDGDVAADRLGAGADIDDVRVAVRDVERADGGGGEGLIARAAPGEAGVRCLPDATAGRAEVEGRGLLRHARDRRDASATGRTDHAIVQTGELRRIVGGDIGRTLRLSSTCEGKQNGGTADESRHDGLCGG